MNLEHLISYNKRRKKKKKATQQTIGYLSSWKYTRNVNQSAYRTLIRNKKKEESKGELLKIQLYINVYSIDPATVVFHLFWLHIYIMCCFPSKACQSDKVVFPGTHEWDCFFCQDTHIRWTI